MNIKVELAQTGFVAFMTVSASQDENVTVGELQAELVTAGVSFGVKADVLNNISNNKVYNKKHIIAEAKHPTTGENGKIKIKVRVKREEESSDPNKPKYDKVDHYGVRPGFLTFVKKGQVLAQLFPPTKGEDGIGLKGELLEGLMGKEKSLKNICGELTEVDGDKLIASEDGIYKKTQDKLIVENLIEIKRNIDHSTGSIILPLEAAVELVILGDIKSGFTVQCNKITVHGTIEDATITARFLDVKKGIVGKSELPISADFLTTSFIIGKRNIFSRITTIAKEISGGSTVETDFIMAHIIQECNIIAKYGVLTKYLYGQNNVLIGVKIKENYELTKLNEQKTRVEVTMREIQFNHRSLLAKAASVMDLSKRMPNNLSIQRELEKLKEVYKEIKGHERILLAINTKIEHVNKGLYVYEDPFLVIELGFEKKGLEKEKLKSINTIAIKEFTYEKRQALQVGRYFIDKGQVSVTPEINKDEIDKEIETYKENRLKFLVTRREQLARQDSEPKEEPKPDPKNDRVIS